MTTVAANAHPPVDPEIADVFAVARANLPSSATTSAAQYIAARREMVSGAAATDESLSRGGAIAIQELTVPGPAGAPDVPLLVLRPVGMTTQAAPGIYAIHGGGMIAGDNRTRIDTFVDWAVEFGAVLVSVDYRLAPECPDPGPVEDCYAGLSWTAEHAEELGIDPARLIVAGGSAGGGLAAGVVLMARDRGGPALLGQVLMSPMVDDRHETQSSTMLDGVGVWDRNANLIGWTALLGERRGGPDVSVYAAPAREANLAGLPPAFIDVGEVDGFRDEDVTYATRIWQAGGAAELHVWPGGLHGFDQLVPGAEVSRAAISTRTDWVRRLLSSQA